MSYLNVVLRERAASEAGSIVVISRLLRSKIWVMVCPFSSDQR
jgi:hypothetical protein